MFAGIFIPLFLFGGCQQNEHKNETKFEQDLRSLYAKVQSFGSQTRSENGELKLTEEQLVEVLEDMAIISEENGVAETILTSGYYQSEIIDFSVLDEYELLQWIEANSTSEMYESVLSILNNEPLSFESIIENDQLLPNEKGALVVISSLNIVPPIAEASASCEQMRDSGMRGCRSSTYGKHCYNRCYSIFMPLYYGICCGRGVCSIRGVQSRG